MTLDPQPVLFANINVSSQKLLDRIPQLAWLMNERGEILANNQLWGDYIGRSLVDEARLGASDLPIGAHNIQTEPTSCNCCQTFLDLLESDRREWFTRLWAAANAAQESLKIELTLMNTSGEWEWFQVELEPDRDRSGTTIWIGTAQRMVAVGAAQQLSERNLTQIEAAHDDRQRAERYSERLSSAMQVAKVGAWYWELQEHKFYWTPEFEILFDYEPGSTQKTYEEWAVRIHPDDRQRVEAIVQATVTGKLPQHRCEYRIVCRDGSIRWMDGIGEIRTDEAGKIYLAGLVNDITDRKRHEENLQASEELFRYTFEYTPVGFAHVAPNGQLLRVNPRFCEILGYTKAELLTLTFHHITEPADLAADLALIDRLLQGELQEYTLEKRYIHKQGHHVWVSLTVSLVRSAPTTDGQLGTPRYFLSAIQDITHRKQLESLNQQQTLELHQLNSSLMQTQHQLKERNTELDNFVRIASHDLKAPLRAIANLADWIEEDMADRLNAEDRQQFQLLRQRVKRMKALIDGLLRYSRLGREQLATEMVDVAQLVVETIDSLAPPPQFEIAIRSPLPTFALKRILLSQVFANLLGNAIGHHHRSDGLIEISAVDLGDRYQFSIADDGPGIPVGESRERIFEIFQTLQPSNSTDNTGIGLAIVKKIVEGEGGRIWLTTDRPQGTCFCFTWLKTIE